MVRRTAAAVLCVIALAGCGSASGPAATVPATDVPTGAPTSTAAPTPTPSTAPTPAPTSTTAPQIFDSAAFLEVFASAAVLQQYPAVSGSKVASLYTSAVNADPALGRLLGRQVATTNAAKSAATVLICVQVVDGSSSVDFHQSEDIVGACSTALPRLIWYVNHNSDAKALPLLRALVGYIVHDDALMGSWMDPHMTPYWRDNLVNSLQSVASYLDGRCGGPAGLGTC